MVIERLRKHVTEASTNSDLKELQTRLRTPNAFQHEIAEKVKDKAGDLKRAVRQRSVHAPPNPVLNNDALDDLLADLTKVVKLISPAIMYASEQTKDKVLTFATSLTGKIKGK